MSTIIYARISSPNQAEYNGQHFSIENQISRCTEYCQTNSFNIIDVVTEVVSARDINKQTGLINIYNTNSNCNLVVFNISRFSRNTPQALQWVDKFKSKDINIIFMEENIHLNSFIDMHRLRLGLSQSELESNQISHRIKSTNNLLKSKGWKFGRESFGYKSCRQKGIRKFQINKEEQMIMDFIIGSRKGVNCKQINTLLNKIIPNNKIPIKYYDSDDITEIESFSKPNMLTFTEIADILNDYNIKNRSREWNSGMVSRIYKNVANPNLNKISFNSLNI